MRKFFAPPLATQPLKFGELHNILHQIQFKLSYFAIPGILGLVAASLDGLSIAFLGLLIKGALTGDYLFVKDSSWFTYLSFLIPQNFVDTNDKLFKLVLIFTFATALSHQIMRYLSVISACYLARKVSDKMRNFIFQKYMKMGKAFFDQTSLGYLHTTLLTFTNSIATSCIRIQNILIRTFVFVIYFGMMFVISWQLSLIILLIFAVPYWLLQWIVKQIKYRSKKFSQLQKDTSKKIIDILACIPLVKSYAREHLEQREFAHISDKIRRLQFNMDQYVYSIMPLQKIFMLVLLLLLVSIIAILIQNKMLEISATMVFFYLLRENINNIGFLSQFAGEIASFKGPISEISQLLEQQKLYCLDDGKQQFQGLQKKIVIEHLKFSYNEKLVLKDISFTVNKGAMTAIVGPSGAGKTTIINLLLRFYDCPPNSIFIDGTDIRKFAVSSLMPHIALVSQDTFLFNASIRENLLYGLNHVDNDYLQEIIAKARLHNLLEKAPQGLDTIIGDRGIKMSGGEKQRLAIARAMMKKADILFFDEATSSLDSHSEKLIQEALEEVIINKTTIVIAHRLSTIANADKIIVITQGKIVEEGKLKGLLAARGQFYQYWQQQKIWEPG